MIRATKILGMEIYNDKARRVGVVKDLVVDERRGVLVGFALQESGNKVICVPFESMKAIGDIVLVVSKEVQTQQAST